jgi:hypothetical protein
MVSRTLFLPVGALVVLAGYLGLRLGTPMTETEIISHYAEIYVKSADAGATLTDCAATNHPDAMVRMVIVCSHPSGTVTTYLVGPRGQLITPSDGPSA